MARPVPVVEHAMEIQEALRRLRRSAAPMYAAALATGDVGVLWETHALAQTLRVGQA